VLALFSQQLVQESQEIQGICPFLLRIDCVDETAVAGGVLVEAASTEEVVGE
jgi:hypothetical protein